ncbi:MAG: polysaccharide biosynthesis C-terminal domain-containing protein [Bacteroidales bacterium]|jgi:O-antigen/teichoic acid export membrane protein|nr:polysaccharide biosynthesis C-terminal domain-containing protein [Bacteroidales bacterium]
MKDIIQRQTFKGSVYSYIGVLIGFLNTVILMPKLFTTSEIGLTDILVSTSALIAQFGTLGFSNVTAKLFPKFRDKSKNHNGFIFLLLIVTTIGFILCLTYYFIYKQKLIDENIDKSPLFSEYVYLLIPFIFITLFYSIFDTYNKMLFNASFGIFVKEFLLRCFNLVGIILFYFKILDFQGFVYYYTLVFAIPLIFTCVLIIYKGDFSLKPDFKIFKRKKGLKKEVFSVAFWGLIAGFSGTAIFAIDKILINKYCLNGLDDVGIYSRAFYFGSMIMVTSRSFTKISGSIISQSFKENNLAKVEEIYKKSVITLTVLGMLFFLLIWGNVDNILQILGPAYAKGKYVILFVSLAHFVQMIAGTSGELINLGKYYRQFSIIMLFIILSIWGFNILLLPIYGITGAAIALFISFSIYFFIRLFFIKSKYKFQAYNYKFFLIILFGIISYSIILLIPQISNFWLDTIIRSAIICITFCIPIYFFKISPDINEIIINSYKKFTDFFKKINHK